MSAPVDEWITDLLGNQTCLCGATMDIARVEPHPTIQKAEIWTYECQKCSHTLTKTFGDARY